MRISWYLGFGWVAIATLVASGVGINLTDGLVRWMLYVPFLLAGLHMTIRFRAFNTQPWRRIHGRTMIDYGKLAEQEYETAKKEGREFDIETPCRKLVEQLYGHSRANELASLLGAGRKTYYRALAESYPQVFLEGVESERHSLVLDGVRRDIEASKLGPDIVIARRIEQEHNGLEAARYLHALLLGRVR